MHPIRSLFEQRIAPQSGWRQLLGPNFSAWSGYLQPTGARANFLPCPHTATTGCGWLVMPDGTRAVCSDDRCESKDICPSECALMRFDTALLAQNLAATLELKGTSKVGTGGGFLGWLLPAENARCAVFFVVPSSAQSAFATLQRLAQSEPTRSFVVLLPSQEDMDPDTTALLAARNSEVAFLSQELRIEANGRLIAPALKARLLDFALRAAGIEQEHKLPVFPTPPGAVWGDFLITEKTGFEIRVECSLRTGKKTFHHQEVYNFEHLGMAIKHKGELVPNSDWDNFLMPLLRHKRIVAEPGKAWTKRKQAKSKVTGVLAAITGLDKQGAIIAHDGLCCYEAGFKVCCDPGQEQSVPQPPKALPHGAEGGRHNGRLFIDKDDDDD